MKKDKDGGSGMQGPPWGQVCSQSWGIGHMPCKGLGGWRNSGHAGEVSSGDPGVKNEGVCESGVEVASHPCLHLLGREG